MGFLQTSVGGSAVSVEASGASVRSGGLAPLVWLVFALCLASLGHVSPVAAEAFEGVPSFSSHSVLEAPVRTAVQAKVTNRGPRQRVLVLRFEAPAALAPVQTARTIAVLTPLQPLARKFAASAGRAGLPARAPPTSGIL